MNFILTSILPTSKKNYLILWNKNQLMITLCLQNFYLHVIVSHVCNLFRFLYHLIQYYHVVTNIVKCYLKQLSHCYKRETVPANNIPFSPLLLEYAFWSHSISDYSHTVNSIASWVDYLLYYIIFLLLLWYVGYHCSHCSLHSALPSLSACLPACLCNEASHHRRQLISSQNMLTLFKNHSFTRLLYSMFSLNTSCSLQNTLL
jgi:hypothetical protein